jgi:Domain of unknown function (DUF1998)
MKPKGTLRPQGQIRRSQVITTFGPGAMLDLPNHSVILGGLEFWGDPVSSGSSVIREDRLLDRVRRVVGRDDVVMYPPPIDLADGGAGAVGITAFLFPEWYVAQYEDTPRDGVRTRPILNRRDLVKGKYFGPDKKKYPVVPVRFVQACINGHISDLDWHGFVHEYKDDCKRKLWLDERGTSGDLADIFVRCECGRAYRSLTNALPYEDRRTPLGFCRGNRPWLGVNSREQCGGDETAQPNRLLVRSASNAYFPQVLSVISIPESDELLKKAVDLVWEDFLLYVENLDDLKRERRKAKVAPALEGFSDKVVLEEIQRRKTGVGSPDKSIKQAEIETLLAQKESVGEDAPEGDFYATTLPLPAERKGAMRKVERVVLVHRLREVTAQVGFTRFEAATPDIDGELALEVRRAVLSREAPWVPAVENRGEGVLIAVDQTKLDDWAGRAAVKKRVRALSEGFNAWQGTHPKVKTNFPGPRYVLLHSLSHLLITAMSLACGYSASAIRERIYVTPAGSGILLYTGTPDAEGTLGGLVDVGRNIGEHLRAAMEYGTLCANDPVCAQHRPDNPHEERFLHGAACHGCLLIAEPSCERRNEYLDRALVIPTVEGLGAEFFTEDELG